MKTKADHYLSIMLAFQQIIAAMKEAAAAHENCPGCELCWDCEGMLYTLENYNSSFSGCAPWQAARKFYEQYPDELRVEQPDNEPTQADPEPAIVPAKPALAKPRPYWLANED